ncbi:MAG TPA: GntR family transcriptional regulator, partial [Naasia sp.]
MAGRAWETVIDRVERDLASGALRVGDHLPSERTLAADLGVGRSSVREAVRVLEVLGLVRTATGSGPSAGAIVVSKPDGAMSVLMRLQVAGRGFAVE